MKFIDTAELKASKKIKEMIDTLQERLLVVEDALEDIARATEIAEITRQVEMLSTFKDQANAVLAERMVRPDSSVLADSYKMTIITDDESKEEAKNAA